MLHGPLVTLRARAEEDVDVLTAELYDDVSGHARADGRAWRPHPRGIDPPFAPKAPTPEFADFSAVLRDTGELIGTTALWQIDVHNRSAHIGLGLRPAHRGKGYGSEIVETLCRYAFEILGLHRLQIETLTDNAAMIGVALACGFTMEGTTRGSSWVEGSFMDDAVLGLLVEDWHARAAGERS